MGGLDLPGLLVAGPHQEAGTERCLLCALSARKILTWAPVTRETGSGTPMMKRRTRASDTLNGIHFRESLGTRSKQR